MLVIAGSLALLSWLSMRGQPGMMPEIRHA